MSAEKFCLRWNDFETNISVAFKEIREEKDFFDVTLACDDSQIQAHKVILSACSPFFRNVLRRNPHQHPLLYLKGVKYQDLVSVLNFMYNGEVNVAQEELNTFLSVAEDLRVKGLTQNNGGTEKKNPPAQETAARQVPRPREPPERESVVPQQQPKRPRPAPAPIHVTNPVKSYQQPQYDDHDDIQEVVPVKSEPRDPLPPPPSHVEEYATHGQQMVAEHDAIQDTVDHGAVALDQSYAEDGYGYEDYGDGYDDSINTGGMAGAGTDTANKDLETVINSKMTKVPGETCSVWQCLDCEYSSKLKHNVFEHVESKHIQHEGYYCYLCNKSCPSQSAFRMHNKRKHNQLK